MGTKKLSKRIDWLAARIERLESCGGITASARASKTKGTSIASDAATNTQFCSIRLGSVREFGPEVSPDRAAAIIDLGGKWVNHTNLHYFMFDQGPYAGAADQRAQVRNAFRAWKDVGIGLSFIEVQDIAEAELRIGFLRNDGSWSTIGTGALQVAQHDRTMNLGWDITVSGPNGIDTAVHEIGHALGFHHEHQNPNAGIVWNRQAVYDYFAATQQPPWSRATTERNILDTLPPHTVGGSDWDPDSVMHYALAAGLVARPEKYANGLDPAPGLSDADRAVVQHFYPGEGPNEFLDLRPGESHRLLLAPGEQQDFDIRPTETRAYEFRTFGGADTVMVLFEERDGRYRFVEGDDDSGFDTNARFSVRLVSGRKYQLRIRHYYRTQSGATAVMYW